MNRDEFINSVLPTITKIYEQRQNMTVEEFKEFRNDYGIELNKMKNPLCEKFMIAFFESVEKQIFSEAVAV